MKVYTPEQFVGKLGELNVAVGTIPLRTVTEGSALVKKSIQVVAPARLRGVGRRGSKRAGAKLGVRYAIFESGGVAESFIRGAGPWPLIERDVTPHAIPRETARQRVYAVIPNATHGEGVFSHVNHPGTKGKHPFEKGSIAAIPIVEKLFQAQTFSTISRVF